VLNPGPWTQGEHRKSRFSEAQIVEIIKESEAGAKTPELCRRHGISANTFYKWKAKYGGMDVSDVRRHQSLHPPLDSAFANSASDKSRRMCSYSQTPSLGFGISKSQ